MKTPSPSLLVMQYLGGTWVVQAKTHPSGAQEVPGSTGLTWSQAVPSHALWLRRAQLPLEGIAAGKSSSLATLCLQLPR